MELKDDLHDEDGGSDERGRVETPLTVGVLPLPLVHLTPTVLTTSTHAEKCAYQGGEDHHQKANGGTYEESSLIVDPLEEERKHRVRY